MKPVCNYQFKDRLEGKQVVCCNTSFFIPYHKRRLFKLVDSLAKPIILDACKCWGSLKKNCFANKIENFMYQFISSY